MATASTKAKDKYNNKAYDKFFIQLPKGTKEVIDELLEEKQEEVLIGNSSKYSSKTTYIFSCMCEGYQKDTGKDLVEEIKKKKAVVKKTVNKKNAETS